MWGKNKTDLKAKCGNLFNVFYLHIYTHIYTATSCVYFLNIVTQLYFVQRQFHNIELFPEVP